MRYLIVFISCLIVLTASSQKKAKYTIYKMGRPDSFERNNALKDVQSTWKLNFVSVGTGIYTSNLDSVIEENKKTELALITKFGDSWQTVFMKEVDDRVKTHNEIRELVKKDMVPLDSLSNETLIEVDIKSKRKAIAKVFGLKVQEGQSKYFIFYKYKVKRKKNLVTLVSSELHLIDFSYPENGIRN